MALTETRKADRARMVAALRTLAAECGAEMTADPMGPREVSVYLHAPGGLSAWISIDGDSPQPDVLIVAWHMRGDPDAKLKRSFGEVNPYHQRKATHVAYGFDALVTELRRGLTLAASGEAYE